MKAKKIMMYLFVFTLILLNTLMVFAEETPNGTGGINTAPGELTIPFEKNWAERVKEDDRKPVTVTLYKYIGDFNEETAIKVEEVVVKYDEDPLKSWKYEFDISKETLMDENNNHYKFKVVETQINGYKEVKHIDPEVEFQPPTVGDSYKRYDTNKTKKISLTEIGETKDTRFIVGTLTQADNPNTCISGRCDFVVWSEIPLSEGERKLIAKTILISDLGAQYNSITYESTYFISGTGEFGGMSVNESEINFTEKSNWQHIAGGSYIKSSADANEASITNDIDTKDISVEKIWNDDDNKYELRPTSIFVKLIANGMVIDEVTLNSLNEFKHIWKDLYKYDSDGKLIKYEVEEIVVNNYESSITDTENKFTITNSLERIPVSVRKNWKNVDMFNGDLPNVLVNLLYCKPTEENGNCTKEDSTWKLESEVELNEIINWSYQWENLPKGLVYKVVEVGFTGIDEDDAKFLFEEMFDITYGTENDNDNNFVITNTFKGTSELPETGSTGGLIMMIVSILLLGMPTLYLVYTFAKKSI